MVDIKEKVNCAVCCCCCFFISNWILWSVMIIFLEPFIIFIIIPFSSRNYLHCCDHQFYLFESTTTTVQCTNDKKDKKRRTSFWHKRLNSNSTPFNSNTWFWVKGRNIQFSRIDRQWRNTLTRWKGWDKKLKEKQEMMSMLNMRSMIMMMSNKRETIVLMSRPLSLQLMPFIMRSAFQSFLMIIILFILFTQRKKKKKKEWKNTD